MEQHFYPTEEKNKKTRYEEFLTQYAGLIEGESNAVSVMANTCAALKEAFGFFWVGFYLVEGDTYLLRTILRTSGYKGGVKALLLSEKGEVLVSAPVLLGEDGQWSDVDQKLVPLATSGKGKLALEFDGTGTVWIDYVSLFPEKTFHGRTNGLRNDVATMLADLKPAFVRWPGGCVVEGITLGNRYEWKKSLGDPAARPGEYSTWGYRCSYGFGYYEMLQFCEDIHADAMFVCNVGMACQMP